MKIPLLVKILIEHLEPKISRAVLILSKLHFLFPTSALLLLFYSLIQSHLMFGITIWGSTFLTYLTKL